VLSWGSCPSELSPPRFGVRSLASMCMGSRPAAHLRAPGHRGCIPRPGLRCLDSRAQDPSTRGLYRSPRVTVRRRPSSRSASRTLRAPAASSIPEPCRARFVWSVLPVPPLGGTPRLPALHHHLPRKRATTAGPRRRSFVEPLTRPHPLRGRLATGPLAELGLVVPSPPCGRFGIDPDATGFRHLHRFGRPAPSRGAGRWWAPLLPGGPALVGFRPSSTRLEGASCEMVLAYWLFGSPLRALRLGRSTPSPGRPRPRSPHGLRRGGRHLSLSRARQTFACRGVLRVASFR